MESWSYVSQGNNKGLEFDEMVSSSPDLHSKRKNVFMGWELKTRCTHETDLLVPNQQVNEDHHHHQNQDFGELGCHELVPKQFQEDSVRDVLSCKVGGGGNETMATRNAISGEGDSSSNLSSSVLESNGREESSSFIDLKLGRFGDLSGSQNSISFKVGTVLSSAESTAPMKRVRAVNLNPQTPFCQVHGCNKDLSASKDYHKRHRVCKDHSITPRVIVNGIEQRFCQQCSRFHLLAEFDDGKRSCRKRLAGHNERRRKPQVGISGRNGRFLQSYNGNRFCATALPASFICPEILPTGFLHQKKFETNNWYRRIKLESGTDCSPQSPITSTNAYVHPKPLYPLYNFERQYPSFHDNEINSATGSFFIESSNRYPNNLGAPKSVSCSLYQNTLFGSEDFTVSDTTSSSSSSFQGFSGIADSSFALSLLSPHSHNTSSHSSGIPLADPMVTGLSSQCHAHYNVSQVSERLLGVSPLASANVASNNFTSSGMRSSAAEGNHLGSTFIPNSHDPPNFEVVDGIFQESDFLNAKDRFSCQDGATIDLLQLSSQLHRVEHQRQENDAFCCLRIT